MTSDCVGANCDLLTLYGVRSIGKEIGVGAYGRVFEVNYEGTHCAAKEVHALLLQYAKGNDLQKIKDNFLSECQIWSTLRHPCIVQFLGVYYPSKDQYRLPVMVMEKMQHSLRGVVEKYNNIPLNVKLSILDEVCLGLRYLHSRDPPIVHRDLTPNNILLSYRLEAKISDLGVAKVMRADKQKTMTKLPGTPDFMPPESLSVKPVYGPSLDIFSYGGVILNVTTQLWPQPTDPIEFNSNTGRREVVSEVKRRQEYLDKMTGGAADLRLLVISCLDDNPRNRPLVAQVSIAIQNVKDVYSQKNDHDGMNPIVWWAEVSNEQQLQKTSSLTTALEEMTSGLKREIDVLKTNIAQLKTDNDTMRDEKEQLNALLDKMAFNNEDQAHQINSQSSKIAQLKTEVQQLKQQLQESPPHDDHHKRGPVSIKWEKGATAPAGCGMCTAVLLNGLVYVGSGWKIGGRESFSIECYDPVTNKWLSSISTPYCHFAMTTLNSKLLIAGGEDESRVETNQILKIDSGHLKDYTKMITARTFAMATGHQGMLIITGGINSFHILSSTELFDSNKEQWYTCSNLPQPQWRLKSVIIDNILYLLGGADTSLDSSQTIFTAQLDTLPKQLKWNIHQDAPYGSSAPVCVHDTHLLIIGGSKKIGFDNFLCHSDVYKFNMLNKSWEPMGCIPSARSFSAAVNITDNKVIVIGGKNDEGEYTNTVWIGSCEYQH